MQQTTLTINPRAEDDNVWGFTAPSLNLAGEHQITITADGVDEDVNGHLVWLGVIAAAAVLTACNNNVTVINGDNNTQGGQTIGDAVREGMKGGPRPQ